MQLKSKSADRKGPRLWDQVRQFNKGWVQARGRARPSRVPVFHGETFLPGGGGGSQTKQKDWTRLHLPSNYSALNFPTLGAHALPNVVLNKSTGTERATKDTHVTDTPRPWIDPLRRDVKGYGEGIRLQDVRVLVPVLRCTYVCM